MDSYIIKVLKKVTRGVQLAPFVYLIPFSLVSMFEPWMSDSFFGAVNELLYLPPVVFMCLFALSRLLKLCAWHKTACAIPLVSQLENYIDGYVFQFTQVEIIIINSIIGFVAASFLVFAIKHFFHGRQRHQS